MALNNQKHLPRTFLLFFFPRHSSSYKSWKSIHYKKILFILFVLLLKLKSPNNILWLIYLPQPATALLTLNFIRQFEYICKSEHKAAKVMDEQDESSSKLSCLPASVYAMLLKDAYWKLIFLKQTVLLKSSIAYPNLQCMPKGQKKNKIKFKDDVLFI